MTNASELTQNAPETETMPDKPDKDMVEFTEAEKHLHTYVSLVILQVFQKCDAYKGEKEEVMARDTKRLLNLITDGLPKDLVPNMKFDKMAQSVYKELVRVFGRKLKSKIREQDPDEETSIIVSFQTKLKKHTGKLPATFGCTSFSAICGGFVVGVIVMVAILVLAITFM